MTFVKFKTTDGTMIYIDTMEIARFHIDPNTSRLVLVAAGLNDKFIVETHGTPPQIAVQQIIEKLDPNKIIDVRDIIMKSNVNKIIP